MTFPVFSRAGAAGRIALIEAGAKLLGVPADNAWRAAARSIGGEPLRLLWRDRRARRSCDASFTADELAKMPIKPASERRLIGRDADAIDIPAKTNGTARYGIDATVDGMVYARPKIPPTRNGSRVRSIDDAAAKKVKGYIRSLALEDPSDTVPGWVMVFASSYPAAIRAADLVKVDWAAGSRRKRFRAGHSQPWREADRRSEGRRAAGGRPGPRRRVSVREVDVGANLHDRAACCTASSSRSTRSPSKRTACSRSMPAPSGRASSCPCSPRRSADRKSGS